jgi:ABC-type phosphate/phosphonate transport system substrate-binding protein
MISRRSLLGTFSLAFATSNLSAFWEHLKFYLIGINDSLVISHGKEDEKTVLDQSISEVFDVPGHSKCQFEFGTGSTLANRLQEKEINLAVMSGMEYAWIMAKYPLLMPLAVAYNSDVRTKACVLVREDSSAKSIISLQGRSISLPERLQQYAYIYLHHAIAKARGEPKGFFGKSITPSDSNEGIEGVLENKADAILLDWDAWKGYQERKPARAKKLRVLSESFYFPTTAIIYNTEAQSKLEIPLLKVAICGAHEKPLARQILNIWGIKQFVLYGPKYKRAAEEMLAEIPKEFISSALVTKP